MTSYFSASFLCLVLPLTALLYEAVPGRLRWGVLLAASHLFIWRISGWGIVFVWACTVVVFSLGLAIGRIRRWEDDEVRRAHCPKRQIRARAGRWVRAVLGLGVATCVGMLWVLKYPGVSELLWHAVARLLPTGVTAPVAPVGISFYTLMAVSYLVDVSRGTVKPDRILGHVALYLCFFPTIMEGPIVRYDQVAPSLFEGRGLSARGLYAGSLRMLAGLAKKLVVADRLNPLVATVFDGYESLDGAIIAAGAALYTLQLYCDFSGTMDMALGIGDIFGIRLPENFRQPFFSLSASEFWQRWHITLGTWFRDYVYYPISLSRPMKALTKAARRRLGKLVGPTLVSMVALFCVWLGNGLWHGAGTQYLAFGMYYFAIISIGGIVEVPSRSLAGRLSLSRDSFAYSAMRMCRTLCIVVAGELIFRSSDAHAALSMLRAVATRFSLGSLTGEAMLSLGLDSHDLWAVLVGAVLVLALDLMGEAGISVWDAVSRRGALLRWGAWLALLTAVVVFGAYGAGYAPVDPMYARY